MGLKKGFKRQAAAVAAVALVTAWGAPAEAGVVVSENAINGTVTPLTKSLENVYLFYNPDSSGFNVQTAALPDAPAGTGTTYSVDTGGVAFGGFPYTVMGVYGDGLISIALRDELSTAFVVIGGSSFESTFPNFVEADVAASLVTGDLTEASDLAMQLFQNTFDVGAPIVDGDPAALLAFSDATFDGNTTAFSAVPEPAAIAIIGLAGTLLLGRRRRAV